MLVVLIWILRILVVLILLRFVLRLLFPSRGPAPGRSQKRAAPERLGGELVRDPQCGTYVPKARALVAGSGADVKYFCSEKCRDEHLAGVRSSKFGPLDLGR